MCSPPVTQICAIPSHPLLPYLALHTSTRPFVGLQDLRDESPATTVVSNTIETVQSSDAVLSTLSHALETLSPSLSVKGLDWRAQWYGPHEWNANAVPTVANKPITAPT